MQNKGDRETITISKNMASGAFLKTMEFDWLRYLGFSEADLKKDAITLVFELGKDCVIIRKPE